MIFNSIKNFLLLSVADGYNKEFTTEINKINLNRAKITAITFIVLQLLQLTSSYLIKRDDFFKTPNVYYGVLYIIMLLAMIVYFMFFTHIGKNISNHELGMNIVGFSFTGFILFWCAAISLLDQISTGQVIVYIVALLCVAVTPYIKPVPLFILYSLVHSFFLGLMPYFQNTVGILFGNYINSTTILVIAWIISYMRFKTFVNNFNNKMIIQEKSEELKQINYKLEITNQKLEKLSQMDGLTGIFNRSMFDRTVKADWDLCKCQFKPLSLIMIDIDFFKIINDSYGHLMGDTCLKQIASVLLSCAKRSSDIVSRYGGEEFAVILPYMEKEHALILAEKMRKNVEELRIPHTKSSVSNYVTISIGVNTIVPSKETSIEEFIKTADKALYQAKEQRNNIVVA